MSAQGATPFTPTSRHVGAAHIPVRQVRTQSLRAGDTVLMRQKKYTVALPPEKNSDGRTWRVTLTPDKIVSKPAGFIWAVLDNFEKGPDEHS